MMTYIYGRNGWDSFDLFGYTSHGLPGLEIHGVGTSQRTIKEKILYLSRVRKIKIPLRRFVICSERELNKEESTWIEFPLLLMYWGLAEQIKLKQWQLCATQGRVSPRGDVGQLILTENVLPKQSITRFILHEADLSQVEYKIPAEDVIGRQLNFKFCSFHIAEEDQMESARIISI